MDSVPEADEALEPLNPKTAVSVGEEDTDPPTPGSPTSPAQPAAVASSSSAASRFEVEKVPTPEESPDAAANDGSSSRHTRFAVDVIEMEPQPLTGHNITIHITDTSKANGT